MTENILLSTGSQEYYARAVKQLIEETGANPVYWITTSPLKSTVNHNFTNVVTHDSFDCIRGVFPNEVTPEETDALFLQQPLDSGLLTQLREYESTALAMMDRLDVGEVTGTHMTYRDRRRHYLRIIAHWQHVLDTVSVDRAIFVGSPHLVTDYVLYALLKNRRKKTTIVSETRIPELSITKEGVHGLPNKIEAVSRSSLSDSSKKYLSRIRSEYDDAKPRYMERKPLRTFVNKLTKVRKLWGFDPQGVAKTTRPYEKSSHTTTQVLSQRFKSYLYRRALEREYDSLSQDVDTDDEYVYLPLHYQPERTTSPEGGDYTTQSLVVNLVAEVTGEATSVYVKEHPTQFRHRNSDRGRTPQLYRDIDEISGTQLINHERNSFELIDNSEFVCTVTGTAGWEAVVRGTPSIVFGSPWYQSAPGCYKVTGREELRTAVEEVSDKPSVEYSAVDEYVSKLEATGYSTSLFDRDGVDTAELADAFSGAA